jgi:hypothetical protein
MLPHHPDVDRYFDLAEHFAQRTFDLAGHLADHLAFLLLISLPTLNRVVRWMRKKRRTPRKRRLKRRSILVSTDSVDSSHTASHDSSTAHYGTPQMADFCRICRKRSG